jgi:hypothetical protein
MNWPTQGIHSSVPFALYRADDIKQTDDAETVKGKSVSKSMITDFVKDPGAWKSAPPKEQTAVMKGGSLLDCLLTTPDVFANLYRLSPFDSFRTNAAKEWKEEMASAGVEVISQDQLDLANGQMRAIYAHDAANQLLQGAEFQVAFRHRTKHGFDSKGLIDIVPADSETLVDLKTCEPRALESKRSLQKYIFDWAYHVQAGAYCEGYSIASGTERNRFKFLFVTSKLPVKVAVVELPLPAILFGADIYRNGIAKFAKCLDDDYWPSMWDGEVELDLPEYAYSEGGE